MNLAADPRGGPAPAWRAAARTICRSGPAGRSAGPVRKSVALRSSLVWRIALGNLLAAALLAGAAVLGRGGAEDVVHGGGWGGALLLQGVAVAAALALVVISAIDIVSPMARLSAVVERACDGAARSQDGRLDAVALADLAARPDEVGRLTRGLDDLAGILNDRTAASQTFAADVAHEVRNPLASLRSAAGAMRYVTRRDQQAQLIDIIEHDVRRLDRLVDDIAMASRLSGDIAHERAAQFDLAALLRRMVEHQAPEACADGVTFAVDLPAGPIRIRGIEGRLAQVFANLVGNAISFSRPGDHVRIWARRRAGRVVVAVEDTGPGIPDSATEAIFDRFYSRRSDVEFGNNSGLGLSISRQIVESHGGVIWAENICPNDADPTSTPLGARLVVGLPA